MRNNPLKLYENSSHDALSFALSGTYLHYFLFSFAVSFLLTTLSIAENLEEGAYTRLNWKDGSIDGTGELLFAEGEGNATCGELYPSDSFYLTDVPRGATVEVDLSVYRGEPRNPSYPVFGLDIFEKYEGSDGRKTNMLFEKDNVDAEGDEKESVKVTTKHQGAVWIGIYGSEPYPCSKENPPYNGKYHLSVSVEPPSETKEDGEPGSVLWSYQTDYWVVGAPKVQNGMVYATSMDGYVYALDKKTGKKEWFFDTGGEIWNQSPVLESGMLYVSAYDDGRLFALDAETGKQKWTFNTGDSRPGLKSGG